MDEYLSISKVNILKGVNLKKGDLLQFDSTNNKTRVIFEYYCSNDGANGKRPAYNIKGNPLGATDCFQMMFNKDADGNGYIEPTGVINCHPNDYRPMKLFRLMKTFATALPNRGNVNHLRL